MNLFTRNSPYYHLIKYLLFFLKLPVYLRGWWWWLSSSSSSPLYDHLRLHSVYSLIFLNFSFPCIHIFRSHNLSLYMSFSFAWSSVTSVKPQNCGFDGGHHEGCVWRRVDWYIVIYVSLLLVFHSYISDDLLLRFQRLRNATVSFVISVCLPTHPSTWRSSALTRQIFMKFGIWVFFENLFRKFKLH